MHIIGRLTRCIAAISLLSTGGLVGCGDSGGGSASDSNSDSQSGTDTAGATESATEPTTSDSQSGGTTGASGGMSESMGGTTGAEGGMSDSMSGSASSDSADSVSGSGSTASTEGMTGGSETTDGPGSSSGEPIDCRSIGNQMECEAAGCMPILGGKFVSDNAGLCLEPPAFLACEVPMACDAVITTVCKGNVKYQLPSGCIPEGFMECPSPPDPGMNGFDEC